VLAPVTVTSVRIGRIALVVLTGALIWPLGASLGTIADVEPLPESFCTPIVRGAGNPQFLIASDLPVRGADTRAFSLAMRSAIRFMLERRGYRAGKYWVGYQACDDSSPQGASGDLGKCAANAKAYAADKSVIGVVGTWSSRCSGVEIPILNQAPSGPLALISPSNTNVGLTHAGAATERGEPLRYYPTGKRNFVRIISADDAQGVADALLAKQLGLRRVFVLNDRESYGTTVASPFQTAARRFGLRIAGTGSWDVGQSKFDVLSKKVARSGADGVFLGGYECPGCGVLVRDLRAALGRRTAIIAPDGFNDIPSLVKAAGVAATEGLYVSVPGLPTSSLSPLGRQIARKFGPSALSSGGPPYAAQAVDVLLQAIAQSDGTRASVTEHLLRARVRGGILGDLSFDQNGDPTLNPVTILRIRGGIGTIDRVVSPRPVPAR
jgi:branched-chain amino acid transport system substrate-binding protein